jgi:hypothetical protein
MKHGQDAYATFDRYICRNIMDFGLNNQRFVGSEVMLNQFYSRISLSLLIGIAMLLAACSRKPAPDADIVEEAQGVRSIALMATGQVPESAFLQTVEHVKRHWWTDFRIVMPGEQSVNLEGIRPESQDACLLILYNDANQATNALEAVMIDGNRALLNVVALDALARKSANPAQMLQRLINKESMRAIGLMLGMSECPFGRCALYQALTDKELGYKGQNYCPPCWGKCAATLEKNNLKYYEPVVNFPQEGVRP